MIQLASVESLKAETKSLYPTLRIESRIDPKGVHLSSGVVPFLLIDGEQEWLDRPITPASTFKVFLAWAFFDSGVATLATRQFVDERRVSGAPGEVDFCTAMYYSSNQFFQNPARRLGRDSLRRYLVAASLSSDPARQALPSDWLSSIGSVVYGGGFLITPRENHLFLRRLLASELPSPELRSVAATELVRRDVIEVMRWPSAENLELYAKTGSMGGWLWINGFGRRTGDAQGEWQVVTLLARAPLDYRPQLMEQFYRHFGSTAPETPLPVRCR